MNSSDLRSRTCWLTILFCFLFSGQAAWGQSSVSLTYVAKDLPDSVVGQDLWSFEYSMKGFTFLKNQGLSIFFDPSTYDGLEDPFVSINTDWDAIAVQPEIILHQPGYLDAVALKDAPSDLAVFSVSVTWRGVGVPGPQPFAIYGTDFLTLASGQSQVVPEPGCLAYLGLGLLVLYRLPALGKKHPTQIAL